MAWRRHVHTPATSNQKATESKEPPPASKPAGVFLLRLQIHADREPMVRAQVVPIQKPSSGGFEVGEEWGRGERVTNADRASVGDIAFINAGGAIFSTPANDPLPGLTFGQLCPKLRGGLVWKAQSVHRRSAARGQSAASAVSSRDLARQGRPRDDLGGRQGNDAAGEGD